MTSSLFCFCHATLFSLWSDIWLTVGGGPCSFHFSIQCLGPITFILGRQSKATLHSTQNCKINEDFLAQKNHLFYGLKLALDCKTLVVLYCFVMCVLSNMAVMDWPRPGFTNALKDSFYTCSFLLCVFLFSDLFYIVSVSVFVISHSISFSLGS